MKSVLKIPSRSLSPEPGVTDEAPKVDSGPEESWLLPGQRPGLGLACVEVSCDLSTEEREQMGEH